MYNLFGGFKQKPTQHIDGITFCIFFVRLSFNFVFPFSFYFFQKVSYQTDLRNLILPKVDIQISIGGGIYSLFLLTCIFYN